jgi:monoterpene epsilon-lactone hydrolase
VFVHRRVLFVALVSLFCGAGDASPPDSPASAAPAAAQPYYIPASVSPQAAAIYNALIPVVMKRREGQKPPHTPEEFVARRSETLARAEPQAMAQAQKLGMAIAEQRLGDVPVIATTPPDWRDDGTILIHVHGGGFVGDSARSSLGGDALMARATGKRIVSVDYTVAPAGNWRMVTDQVVAVYRAVLAQGYAAASIGMFGDSGGGNIVATSTLKLRDLGMAMPAALVLLSPGTDLAQSGDTNATLKSADPALGTEDLQSAFALYADRADWKNPYVSPVYGDFTKGYPPVLIQAGTKEMLLSDSVRLYQAVKQGGGTAVLDVYEGMSHVFQSYMMDTPEQKTAYAAARQFFADHLQARSAAAGK